MINKILSFLLILMFSQSTIAQKKVYVAEVEGTIDMGLAPYIRRVVETAGEENASAIIFKINTFGGRVDAATQIKDAILNSKVRTIAFIDKRAISAGALIALSNDKIAMVPGSSIGAATVVNESGQKLSEKYQSYMRSEMRATAERTGRRTDIAEGMVDEKVVVKGIDDDSTKLITLTSAEAKKYGIADTITGNFNELLRTYNLENAVIINSNANWAEEFVRFLNNPLVSSLLIMIGLVGLFVEIKTPGWGLPGTAAVIALALFFGANYILKLASIIEIVIFIAGVILLILEIFVIPGFGITGILGIILMVAGLFLGLVSDFPVIDFTIIRTALVQLAGAFLTGLLIILGLSRVLPKTQSFNTLILHDEISQKGFRPESTENNLSGSEGIALTVLRPSGTAVINEKRIDVITEGEFIEQGKKICVVKVEGSKVVVREINHS